MSTPSQSLFGNSKQSSLILGGGPLTTDFYKAEELEISTGTVKPTVLELGITGYKRVHRLMTVMEQDTPHWPQWPSENMFRLRVRLDLEEFFEKIVLGYYNADPVQILDGACDVEVVGIGSAVAFGIDYDLAIAEVDRSNLSKLGPDGKPIKREDGKFLKGKNYTPANLVQFLGDLATTPAPYDTKAIVAEELVNVLFGEKNFLRNAALLKQAGLVRTHDISEALKKLKADVPNNYNVRTHEMLDQVEEAILVDQNDWGADELED